MNERLRFILQVTWTLFVFTLPFYLTFMGSRQTPPYLWVLVIVFVIMDIIYFERLKRKNTKIIDS